MSSSETVLAARAKPASASASRPLSHSTQRLLPFSSQITGASGASAPPVSVTLGRISYSISISSAASCASAPGFGDHQGDRVADEADLLRLQDRARRREELGAALAGDVDHDGELADAVGGGVMPGQHRNDAGRRFRRRHVDRQDAGMRVRRAQHIGLRLAGPVDVVGIGAAARQQPDVLLAPHRLADPELVHGSAPLFPRRKAAPAGPVEGGGATARNARRKGPNGQEERAMAGLRFDLRDTPPEAEALRTELRGFLAEAGQGLAAHGARPIPGWASTATSRARSASAAGSA